MQRSPLQLDWVAYPSAAFEALFNEQSSTSAQPCSVSAHVAYRIDGNHVLELSISSTDADVDVDGASYSFRIEAAAGFSFDLDEALTAYKAERDQIPVTIAVNMARILYTSAREYLALITSRAPHGSLLIESILIGPDDVVIGSIEPQAEIMEKVFGLSNVGNREGKPKKRRPAG